MQDCDKCRKFATDFKGEGVAPKTGPNNLNERIMKQVMNESHEVWVLCEQWQTQEGIHFEIYSSDIMLFASLEEAQEEWRRRRDDRMNREGCKVTASAKEDDNREFVQAKNYLFTNEQDYSFIIRTLFLHKTYWK